MITDISPRSGGPKPKHRANVGYIVDVKKLPKLHRAVWKGKQDKVKKLLVKDRRKLSVTIDMHERLDIHHDYNLWLDFQNNTLYIIIFILNLLLYTRWHDSVSAESVHRFSARLQLWILVVKRGRNALHLIWNINIACVLVVRRRGSMSSIPKNRIPYELCTDSYS